MDREQLLPGLDIADEVAPRAPSLANRTRASTDMLSITRAKLQLGQALRFIALALACGRGARHPMPKPHHTWSLKWPTQQPKTESINHNRAETCD